MGNGKFHSRWAAVMLECELCGQGGERVPCTTFAHLTKLHLKRSDYFMESQENLQWFLFSGTKYLLFFVSESFSDFAPLKGECIFSHRYIYYTHTCTHSHVSKFTNCLYIICVCQIWPSIQTYVLVWILIYLTSKMLFTFFLSRLS